MLHSVHDREAAGRVVGRIRYGLKPYWRYVKLRIIKPLTFGFWEMIESRNRVDLKRNSSIGASVSRLRLRGLNIGSFISIGAGTGDDSDMFHRMLVPDSRMLLIEAQETHRAALEKLRNNNPRQDFVICAAAPEDGEVTFMASAPTGGVVADKKDASTITVPARSIDSLVREKGLAGPYFLKFDTHGVELDILAGATETLKKTDLIMMECYNFKMGFVGGKNLTFGEMCSYLEGLGFRCADLSDPLYRPNDYALWQLHLYFLRSDHPMFNSSGYSAPLNTAPLKPL